MMFTQTSRIARSVTAPFCFSVAICGWLWPTLFILPVVQADLVNLYQVAGTPSGEMGWDQFMGTYAGPHNPDAISNGMGSAAISVSPGGIITSTQNLYSFFSTPVWQFSATGLKNDLAFTSVAIQLAASGDYTPEQFLLNGLQPDELYIYGQASLGGFNTNFYWSQWRGLTPSDNLIATLTAPAGAQHLSLAAAKFSYFNTAEVYNIQAVPEPSGLLLLSLLSLGALARRRKPWVAATH